jgi:hypothetical protein
MHAMSSAQKLGKRDRARSGGHVGNSGPGFRRHPLLIYLLQHKTCTLKVRRRIEGEEWSIATSMLERMLYMCTFEPLQLLLGLHMMPARLAWSKDLMEYPFNTFLHWLVEHERPVKRISTGRLHSFISQLTMPVQPPVPDR